MVHQVIWLIVVGTYREVKEVYCAHGILALNELVGLIQSASHDRREDFVAGAHEAGVSNP